MSGDILVPELRGQKGRQIDPKLDLWKYFEIAWLYDHIRFFVCVVCMWINSGCMAVCLSPNSILYDAESKIY